MFGILVFKLKKTWFIFYTDVIRTLFFFLNTTHLIFLQRMQAYIFLRGFLFVSNIFPHPFFFLNYHLCRIKLFYHHSSKTSNIKKKINRLLLYWEIFNKCIGVFMYFLIVEENFRILFWMIFFSNCTFKLLLECLGNS